MLKKTIKFTDYNGVERTEDFFFNLTKAEIMKLEMGTTGGLAEAINEVIAKQDVPRILEIFEEIIAKAYGEKSADGRRFEKSAELSTAFMETEAYSELFMELVTDAEAANKFMEGIIPADAVAAAKAQQKAVKEKN